MNDSLINRNVIIAATKEKKKQKKIATEKKIIHRPIFFKVCNFG